jgi:hypothetical protein
MAPGIATTTALSTSSIAAIDTVSATTATRTAARSGRPGRRTRRTVNAYPNRNASTTARAIVGTSPRPVTVPITMPRISPMAQPARQCRLTLTAMPQPACVPVMSVVPADEGERGLGSLPPAAVDGEGVAPARDLDDLGGARIVLLLLV